MGSFWFLYLVTDYYLKMRMDTQNGMNRLDNQNGCTE